MPPNLWEVDELLRIEREQKIFEIGGVKIGGQPGELPTVLIGSLFHEGHKIVKDRRLGIFDKKKAERLIRIQEEMSNKTGVPCMLDIVAEYPEALIKYIDFVSEVTDVPFLINGPRMSVRVAAARHAVEVGLKERAVYNSINYTLNREEIDAIRETELETAIIQAFNPRDPRPKGMISILEGNSKEKGLLDKAFEAGIKKPLLFMPVLDVPSIGWAAHGIYLAKKIFGMPTGTAPIGVVGRWSKAKGIDAEIKRLYRAGAAAIVQVMNADFIIYGSVAKAKNIFPVCAMIDAIIAYAAQNFGVKPLVRTHPFYRIFRG
ncbi:tetrahydromethanopterin S-methyltransferase subunit H [Candidatus Bathyarchaeota archaeon]|nr:MAG: tetrahydromethanopterin S-methyltransferase subunit H [Candidatus Bathyarchaeota archaeon]HDM88611.1 tetrahydromethanopterin S-methyltransferase subunit H [Candidatus Bathyarchaeota archaeon]